ARCTYIANNAKAPTIGPPAYLLDSRRLVSGTDDQRTQAEGILIDCAKENETGEQQTAEKHKDCYASDATAERKVGYDVPQCRQREPGENKSNADSCERILEVQTLIELIEPEGRQGSENDQRDYKSLGPDSAVDG